MVKLLFEKDLSRTQRTTTEGLLHMDDDTAIYIYLCVDCTNLRLTGWYRIRTQMNFYFRIVCTLLSSLPLSHFYLRGSFSLSIPYFCSFPFCPPRTNGDFFCSSVILNDAFYPQIPFKGYYHLFEAENPSELH